MFSLIREPWPNMKCNAEILGNQWAEPTIFEFLSYVAATTLRAICSRYIKVEFYGQSEPASTTASVGGSVHKMGCVFHPSLHPTLTNILPQSNFLPADLWPLFFGAKFFSTLTLHTTLPPSYPTNLPTLLTYLLA
jgi:hypothetical protein